MTVPLSAVATVVRGVTFDKDESRDEPWPGSIPILRAGNIANELIVDDDLIWVPSARVNDEQRMRSGDIAVCMSSGSPAVVGKSAPLTRSFEGSVGAFCAIVRPISAQVIPDYLSYFMRSERFRRWTRQSSGSAIKNIRKSELESFPLPLLDLAEQRRVVDQLMRAEGIVRLRREAWQKAAELIPAIFIDTFGDPATNPLRLTVRRVADFVARFEGGKNLQAGDAADSAFRILKVSAATSGTYVEAECKPTPNGYVPPINHFVRTGDLLFSRANTVELVGATAIVEATNGKTLLPDKLWRFVWREDADVAYMHALFQTPAVRRELSKLASGTSNSMRNISQAKLFELSLPIADIDRQRKFGDLSKSARSVIAQQTEALSKATGVFDALLSQTFG